MKNRHRNQNPFPSEESILEAVRLHEEGWTLREIGQKMGRAASGIHRWIHEYAPLIVNNDMKTNEKKDRVLKRMTGPSTNRGKRATGVKAPETTSGQQNGDGSLEQKVARLERELKDARLMRDFYNEMINVAEKQFDIPIRKKAGTRR